VKIGDAGTDATVVRLGEDLPGVTYLAGDEDGEAPNPHVWLDADYAARYVDRIEAALKAAHPEIVDVVVHPEPVS